MKIQNTYSTEEFADQVGEKVAIIRTFQIIAWELNLIQSDQLLTESFLPAWDTAQQLHSLEGVEWEDAIRFALGKVFGISVNPS
ncbi:hypothetical protein D1B33_14955 [Lysinibacillus yapensis]|uniref:Uncharacterized protein n=1 Tax=Ureibacillus yapensis TaxID=2304605 RepID=A0A396S4L5_9BACL|nr:hypothetical protein [Lysinibacillus yapensis]RHW34089.1 hypothetical protein D1B33_14955 [Lysinibacillus yapensis]